MKKFKEVKQIVLDVARAKGACTDEYRRVYSAKNKKEVLKVIKDNASWCYYNAKELVSKEVLDNFSEKICNELGVFYKGIYEEIKDRKGIILIGDAKVKMLDNSQVGEMWDNSQVGEMLDNSQVGEMLDNSQVGKMLDNSQVGEMWGNSQVGKMWDNSQVGKMLDNSQVGEMWGNSQVGKMWGNSQVGKMWDNSQVGEMWGNSQVGEMLGNSQVGKMWDNSQVGEMWGNSQVGKMWSNSISRSYNGNHPKEFGDRYCFIDLKNKKVYFGEKLSSSKKETK